MVKDLKIKVYGFLGLFLKNVSLSGEMLEKGFDKFGDHNKDKNGEVIIPMTVKIIKKELNIPKKDPVTPLDMDVEEK